MIARRYDYRKKYVAPAKKLQEWEAGPSRDKIRVRFFAPSPQEARKIAVARMGLAATDGRIFYLSRVSHDIGASA
jgi:hypothetical protein